MNEYRRGDVRRGAWTLFGFTVAAMVVIAGLVLLATFIALLVGMANFGSNK